MSTHDDLSIRRVNPKVPDEAPGHTCTFEREISAVFFAIPWCTYAHCARITITALDLCQRLWPISRIVDWLLYILNRYVHLARSAKLRHSVWLSATDVVQSRTTVKLSWIAHHIPICVFLRVVYNLKQQRNSIQSDSVRFPHCPTADPEAPSILGLSIRDLRRDEGRRFRGRVATPGCPVDKPGPAGAKGHLINRFRPELRDFWWSGSGVTSGKWASTMPALALTHHTSLTTRCTYSFIRSLGVTFWFCVDMEWNPMERCTATKRKKASLC